MNLGPVTVVFARDKAEHSLALIGDRVLIVAIFILVDSLEDSSDIVGGAGYQGIIDFYGFRSLVIGVGCPGFTYSSIEAALILVKVFPVADLNTVCVAAGSKLRCRADLQFNNRITAVLVYAKADSFYAGLVRGLTAALGQNQVGDKSIIALFNGNRIPGLLRTVIINVLQRALLVIFIDECIVTDTRNARRDRDFGQAQSGKRLCTDDFKRVRQYHLADILHITEGIAADAGDALFDHNSLYIKVILACSPGRSCSEVHSFRVIDKIGIAVVSHSSGSADRKGTG